jgi:hypothetical protein
MLVVARAARVLMFFSACALAGCSSKKAEAPFRPLAPAVVDRNVLSRSEILSTQFTNLYDVVLMLRGNWLRVRPADSFETSSSLKVYLDSQRVGGADELKTMLPGNVYSVRFLDPVSAGARYGIDHGAGAILVTTAKR